MDGNAISARQNFQADGLSRIRNNFYGFAIKDKVNRYAGIWRSNSYLDWESSRNLRM